MAFSNRAHEVDGNGSTRRLFRPSITDFKRPNTHHARNNGNGGSNRPAPPESTSAENFYYLKQMNARTPMVIVMTDGETMNLSPASSMCRPSAPILMRDSVSGTWAMQTTEFKEGLPKIAAC